jgi:hypothetical protein
MTMWEERGGAHAVRRNRDARRAKCAMRDETDEAMNVPEGKNGRSLREREAGSSLRSE